MSKLSIALSIFVIASIAKAYKPSWCYSNRLSQTEWTICSNKELYELDNRMSKLYRNSTIPNKIYSQKRWLKRRNSCGIDVECLKRAYYTRIEQLKSNKPSWCNSRLNLTEWTICSNRELYELDKEMVRVYKASNIANKSKSQKYWLENVRDACGDDIECIKSAYNNRIYELQHSYSRSSSNYSNSNYSNTNQKKSINIRNCQENFGAIACSLFVDGDYKGRIYYKAIDSHSYNIDIVGSAPMSPAIYNESLHQLSSVKCGNTRLGAVHSLSEALYMVANCSINGSLR